MDTKNSSTFLDIFNQLDDFMDKKINSRKWLGFADKLNFLAEKEPVIRNYKRDLQQFNSLRNVIVHRYRSGTVIAEPNDATVKLFKKIWDQIKVPIKLKDTPFIHEVFSVDPESPIGDVIPAMSENFYSQVPVISGGKLTDFLSNNTIALWLAANVNKELVDLKSTRVKEVLKHMEFRKNYMLASMKALLIEVPGQFESYRKKGKYLDAILITRNGKRDENPVGIITVEDLPEIQSLLSLDQAD